MWLATGGERKVVGRLGRESLVGRITYHTSSSSSMNESCGDIIYGVLCVYQKYTDEEGGVNY